MDHDREQLWKNYQICRLSFCLLAISLVPACIECILLLLRWIGEPGLARWLYDSPIHQWISTLCVWGSLAGTMLLWGRWTQPSWQRRTGLLMAMCVADLILWFIDRGDAVAQVKRDWFLLSLGQALGWAEFALLASLCGDYLVHLGADQAEESAKSTRSLAATGAVVWMLRFCEMTHWGRGWPLQQRQFGLQTFILSLATELIWAITLIQVTALIVAAVRHSSRVLREIRAEELEQDDMRWPQDSHRTDLVSSGPGVMATDNWPAM